MKEAVEICKAKRPLIYAATTEIFRNLVFLPRPSTAHWLLKVMVLR
jgi:CO dehydrogenase/acetyl-CoA synthase gamma subunit (corrinoid Fe-S protein)